MKWIIKGTPVVFDGTKDEIANFVRRNPHLKGHKATDAEIEALEEQRRLCEIRNKRALEYPKTGDALDSIAKWLATETEFTVPKELKSWAMTCMSVKSRNPLPKKGKK